MEIRFATINDLIELARLNDQIQAHHAELYPNTYRYPLDQNEVSTFFKKLINSNDNEVLVAASHESLLGYLFYERQCFLGNVFKFERNRYYIHHIVVDKRNWRTGIGSALFDYLDTIAKKANVHEFALDTMAKNTDAQKFFEHGNFSKNKLTYSRQL